MRSAKESGSVKAAAGPLDDPSVAAQNAGQGDAIRRLALLALASGGVGAAVRGVQGLGGVSSEPPPPQPRYAVLPIPVVRNKQLKRANDLDPGFAQAPLTWASNRIADGVGLMKHPGEAWDGARDYVTGWGKSMADKPWAWGAAPLAVGAGLYAGYKGTDAVADHVRAGTIDDELEEAKRRYESALLAHGHKAAEAGTLEGDLDRLYRLSTGGQEKRAVGLGALGGLGVLGLGTVGGLSALGAYQWGRGNSQRKALEEAMRRRQEVLLSRPPMLTAVPTEYEPDADDEGGEPDGDVDDMEIGRKFAGSAATAARDWMSRRKAQGMAAWQAAVGGGGDAKPAKPAEPAPPSLPSVAKPPVAGA